MFDYCLIMAGGFGMRLWPASSSRLPKQFLPADGKNSFFSLALKRALAVTGNSGNIIIITGKHHLSHVIKDCARLSNAQKKRIVIICEPSAMNTAPAIACAVKYSLLNANGNKMLVLTSDHIINPLEAFVSDANLAAASIEKGKLAVFGIKPNRPETGYGYIERGNALGAITNVYNVAAFHEKPDLETAKKYTANKHFYWNSGMFAFSANFLADQFRMHSPEVFLPFDKLKAVNAENLTTTQSVKVLENWHGLKSAYSKTKKISFDNAIVEKCKETVMIHTNFNWIDIGDWEEYIKVCGNNKSEVYRAAEETCYVDSDIPVALAGVNDLIIIIRSGKNGEPAAALITKKGETQKVRHVVEQITKAGKTELL